MSGLSATRLAGLLVATALVSGCGQGGLDFDLRDRVPGGLDTSAAAQGATADRPDPDSSGLITYPTYQVAVARRGDTVGDVAGRIGIGSGELASFNGLQPDSALNQGAILALPRRVTPGQTARPDITTIAGAAIDRASGAARVQPVSVQTGQEPVRHRVARGETAFSIARLYGVSPASLAEWNGLGPDLSVREGQFLLIPLVMDTGSPAPADTPVPAPPSAATALPETVAEETLPPSPALDQFRTEATAEATPPAPVAEPEPDAEPGQLRRPVNGSVLRPFSSGIEGIDYAAPEGTPVTAAAAGTVAAITRDTDQVPILVLRHEGGLLTVYANIKDLRVEKGDTVAAGEQLAAVAGGNPAFLHFEVRRGFDAVDPEPLLR